MGFTINYRSTQPVSPAAATAVRRAARDACRGRTWLSCEPVHFFSRSDDGHLSGCSKPNFRPHPHDVASANGEGLPDGTARDLLDVLCHLSREHGIAWEISHDHSGGPVGLIRDGQCDGDVLSRLEAFADLADYLGNLSEEEFGGP
jgi:hypothetical protein